jgi:hypothetical protein
VGVSALVVAAMFFYQAWPRTEHWRIYAPVILASGLLLFPLVYFSYRGGEEKQPRLRMLMALAYMLFAVLFCVTSFLDLKTGRGSGSTRLFGSFWLFLTMVQMYRSYRLYRAYRERGNLSQPQ